MKVGWQYCSDSPALLIFLKNFWFLKMKLLSAQPFSRQNYLAIFPVFSLPCYTLHGVSLMLWLPSVSAELVYGCTGECGEIGAGPRWYSPAPRCCVACQQQLPVRWELACLASQHKQRLTPPQVPRVYPRMSWAQIFLTSHAHPRLLCPPWLPAQPFLRSLLWCAPIFPFVS